MAAKKSRKLRGFMILSAGFWGHAALKLLIAAVVVAAGWAGLELARHRAVKLPDFQVYPSTLKLTAKPAWVKGEIEKQLAAAPADDRKISLLDSDATARVAKDLAANPWVKEVKSVVREFPDRIRAKVELREPAAYVLRNSRYFLVDAAGVRLPGDYESPADTGLDLLLIVYVRSMPTEPGQVWNDPAVIEGAKVAAFLRKYDDVVKKAKITAIDTSNIGGRRTPRESEITLITVDQTKIFWGRGVETPIARELAPESKIANLKAVLEQENNLREKEYVDLRFPKPVFRDRKYYLGAI